VCSGHFVHDFPLEKLRKDVEILVIEPEVKCIKTDNCNRTENQVPILPKVTNVGFYKYL
jgi:hypothetical protein